jgi:hypothetical protein
MLQTMVNKQNA